MLTRFLLLSFLQALVATAAKVKPATHYFDVCHTSDPHYNECVRNSVMKLKPMVKTGVPDLNIDSMEPLFIPRIEFGNGSGNFKLHQIMTNLRVHGLSNYTIDDVRVDFANEKLNYTVFNPKLDFEGDYELNGQILVLPLKGKGIVTFNFTDVTTPRYAELEEFKKGGKTYLRIKDYKLLLQPKHVTSYFTNLFNGDKVLGEATNKFINDNWQEAFNTYKDLPEKVMSEYTKAVANRVYSLFPKDELYPK